MKINEKEAGIGPFKKKIETKPLLIFSVVILDRKDDPDARDLVFTSQTLVEDIIRSTTPPVNKKVKPSQIDHRTRTVWTPRTSLRKLSLAKDIQIVPHLWKTKETIFSDIKIKSALKK